MIEGARQAGWTDGDNLPVVQAIVETVDCSIAAPDETSGWPLREKACRIFPKDWYKGSWIFGLRNFSSLAALVIHLCQSDYPKHLIDDPDDPHDPDDRGLLHRRCFTDPKAKRKLQQYFRKYVAA